MNKHLLKYAQEWVAGNASQLPEDNVLFLVRVLQGVEGEALIETVKRVDPELIPGIMDLIERSLHSQGLEVISYPQEDPQPITYKE